MARLEPQTVDLRRWPALATPEGVHGPVATQVAQALRRSVRELGVRIDYPDSTAAGDFEAPVRLVLVEPDRFWARLVTDGVVGLGESFMAGEWTSPDLRGAIGALAPWIATHPDCAHPGEKAYSRDPRPGGPGRRRRRGAPVDLEDSVPGSLTALFTDETMSTSGALFASGARTRRRSVDGSEVVHLEAPTSPPARGDLGDAQRRSADTLLALAGVRRGSHVLVATPGWGELPMRAAERGAHVRTLTSNTERLAALGSRFAAAGLDDEISLSLGGIDQVESRIDALLAVDPGSASGMAGLEAVLDLADRLLTDGGRVAVQTLVAPNRPERAAVEVAAWQSRYVSEAGPPVPWPDLVEAIGRRQRLVLRGRVESTAHHAETVRLWSETFAHRGRDAAALGFDVVYRRMWAFHLAALEAGTRQGWLESVYLMASVRESANPGG